MLTDSVECLRDIGLEERALELSHTIHEYSTYNRICKSLVGDELMRAFTFGNNPNRHVGKLILPLESVKSEPDCRVTTGMPVRVRQHVYRRISSSHCYSRGRPRMDLSLASTLE